MNATATTRRIDIEVSYQQAFAAILATHAIDGEVVANRLGLTVPDGHLVTVGQDRQGGEVAIASEALPVVADGEGTPAM